MQTVLITLKIQPFRPAGGIWQTAGGKKFLSENAHDFLTPEPNGVGEDVYGIGRVLRRRRRRNDVCVWTL